MIEAMGKISEGYAFGKANTLRAIEIIGAIAKSNMGFMAIYEPLRERVFEKEDFNLTQIEIMALVKAANEFKKTAKSFNQMNFENEQYNESEGELMPYEGGNEHVNAEYAEYEEIDAPENKAVSLVQEVNLATQQLNEGISMVQNVAGLLHTMCSAPGTHQAS